MKKIILFAIAFFVWMCGTAETKDINLEGNFNVKKISDSSEGGTGSLTVEKNATIMGDLAMLGTAYSGVGNSSNGIAFVVGDENIGYAPTIYQPSPYSLGNMLLGRKNEFKIHTVYSAGFGANNVLEGANAMALGFNNSVKAGKIAYGWLTENLNNTNAQAIGSRNTIDARSNGSYDSGSSSSTELLTKTAIGVQNYLTSSTPSYYEYVNGSSKSELAFGARNWIDGTNVLGSSYTSDLNSTILIGYKNTSSQTGGSTIGIGRDLQVQGSDVIVIGRFNDPTYNPNAAYIAKAYISSQQGPMLVIGNGGYNYYRYNAVVINKNGTIEINGDTTFDGKIKTKKAYGGISMGEFGKPTE